LNVATSTEIFDENSEIEVAESI